jgi:transposase
MNGTTVKAEEAKDVIGADLSKRSYQLAVADAQRRVRSRHRLTRAKFVEFMLKQPPSLVVMEACGSAQYWARRLVAMGHEVKLLPAQHVRAYVRRNKTDAADAAALVQASGCEDIKPVPIKTVEQQVLQQLHRFRSRWVDGRTARINGLRGALREFGVDIPQGADRGIATIRGALELADSGLPDALRPFIEQVLKEIDDCQQQVKSTEGMLKTLTAEDEVVRRLRTAPGVGLIISTGFRAAVNNIHRFGSGRYLSAWVGLTAREHSSGEVRRLGRISKQGDVYLRTQLIQGARSVLITARRADKAGRPLDRLQRWALASEKRIGGNKAAVAVANKLVRIIWALWKHERDYDGQWKQPAPVEKVA